MHINNIWSEVSFLLVAVFAYNLAFAAYDWLKEHRSIAQAHVGYIVALLLANFLVIEVGQWHFSKPAIQQAKTEFYGAPIVSNVQDFKGKVFTPQAFVVTEQRILVYDKDGKVYALDGIKLDGITPEQLTVASNITYTVYQKSDQMLFGKL